MFSIITIIIGILVFFSPNATFVTNIELFLLYIMAAWLIIRGVVGIVTAAHLRAVTDGGMFALAIIISILTLIVGIYSFIHPIVFSGFLGILAGAYFVVEGIDLIVFSIAARKEIDKL
jgi:uncharacterized membrane protein HdeD (DUF308 family)